MKTIICLVLCFALVHANLSQHTRTCCREAGVDEHYVSTYMGEKQNMYASYSASLDDYFACLYATFLSNEWKISRDTELEDYLERYVTKRLEGRRNLAELLHREIVKHCKEEGKWAIGSSQVAKFKQCAKKDLEKYTTVESGYIRRV